MCNKLIQIYQKRTPTFLAEITVIVATLLLLLQPESSQCALQPTIFTFYILVLGLGLLEMLLKLVIFSYMYWKNREAANSYNTIVLFLMAGVHLALWIYSIGLYHNQGLTVCHVRDRFFVKCYVYVYGVMIIGGALLFVILMLSAAGVTVFTLRRANKQDQEQAEI